MKNVVLSVALLTFSVLNAQQTLTPEILWKFNRISGGTVSPDGKYLLYAQRSYDLNKNSGNTDLFLVELKNGRIQQLTKTPFSEMEAQWSNDGSIWFMSSENEGLQLWKINPDGSGKKQCSHFKELELEGFKIAPDQSYILTIEAVKVRKTAVDKYPDLPMANARIEDDLMYRHWDHYDDYMRRHLFLHKIVKATEGEMVEVNGADLLKGEPFDGILGPHGGSEQFCFSSDSKKVVYTSKKKQGKEYAQSTNSELYEYDIATAATRNLTSGNGGYDNYPAYSGQGTLAWLSMAHDGFESDKNDLKVLTSDGKTSNLTKDQDLSVGSFCWHPDGQRIFFISPTKGTEQIYMINVKDGSLKQITSGQYDYVSVAVNGETIYAGRQSMVEPTELYSVTLKKQKISRLTDANTALLEQLKMPKVEERWVETTDGKKMLVWMVYPPNFDPAKKYPALLYCNGGPQSPVSQFFSYRWNLALMAAKGYIVVAPNRRGLPGFGQEWNDAISKDWGGQAMRDYLSAIDNASQEPYVDETRLGAVGASYGGYSVYMLAGIHENRFKTFIAHCGLFNLESWYGTTEELFFANWDQGGPYWLDANKENYLKFSPHKYVQNWNTPILVIHGGLDYRVPESEGMQAFQAAQLKGLRSKYLYFPSESHWVQSPQNSVLWQREFFEWLATDLHP
jgi:dipeptidyl aminopeptidase/acylaminoacyl peptidase